MARNIEIKARIDDFSAMYEKLALLADGLPDIIDQDDTFLSARTDGLNYALFRLIAAN